MPMALFNASSNARLAARKLLAFFISVPLAAFAAVISVFCGNSRLNHQKSIKFLLRAVLFRVNTVKQGQDVLDGLSGPFILAANHVSYLDWMLLYSAVSGDVLLVSDSFFTKFPFSLVTKKAGFLPVRHAASFVKSKELLRILNAVRGKDSIMMFLNSRIKDALDPERDVKPGAAYLSIKTGVPVLPVRIIETKKNRSFKIVFGRPIFPQTDDPSLSREFTKEIYRSLTELN